MSFNRVANAFEFNFKSVFSKDISLKLLIIFLPVVFPISFITATGLEPTTA